jgi:hypothetical protein
MLSPFANCTHGSNVSHSRYYERFVANGVLMLQDKISYSNGVMTTR